MVACGITVPYDFPCGGENKRWILEEGTTLLIKQISPEDVNNNESNGEKWAVLIFFSL